MLTLPCSNWSHLHWLQVHLRMMQGNWKSLQQLFPTTKPKTAFAWNCSVKTRIYKYWTCALGPAVCVNEAADLYQLLRSRQVPILFQFQVYTSSLDMPLKAPGDSMG